MKYKISDDYETELTIENDTDEMKIPITISYYILEELSLRLQKYALKHTDFSKINTDNVKKTGKLSNDDMQYVDMSDFNEDMMLGELVYDVNKSKIDKKIILFVPDFKKNKLEHDRFIRFLGKFTNDFLKNKSQTGDTGK